MGNLTLYLIKGKNFGLSDVEIDNIRDNVVTGYNFLRLNNEILKECGIQLGARASLVELINNLNNQRLLTLEEALSCIPLSVSIEKLTKSVLNLGDHVPDDVFLWDDFLERVNQYEFIDEIRYQRLQFSCSRAGIGEMSAQTIFEFNICEVLNALLPDYRFSRRSTKNPGDLDFTYYFVQLTLLFPIEIKSEYLLEIEEKVQFPEFYKNSAKAKAVIKQIFSYMTENEC
ncbi:hypothetical protein RclHR1_21140003 [Rhizophagus clarus]|uniref:Uncharacterized protein n=1 Tax=Rhizophagus clarus TaxID=94130 RepID=A0A2Z6QX41_9GLOM|nr:hypothetical protein RclHR1_21140003 [Rhizophagus clarus]